MTRLIVKRLVIAVATLLTVSAVMFFGIEALPGDAATSALGQQAADEQQLQTLRHSYGLDRPVVERYVDWLGGAVRGDFGDSLSSGESVWAVLSTNLRNTAVLATVVILLLVPLAVGLGILSALWHDRPFDHVATASTLTFVSTPEFVAGSVLTVIFATWLGLLPPASVLDPDASILSQPDVLALPVLTLTVVAVAQATRMIRASMIEVMASEYIQAARLRGVSRRRLVFRHALPNAFDSTIQIIALTLGWLVGGVVVTEALFQYPGIGSAITAAVRDQDVATVLAASMIVTGVYVVANLLAEIATILLNPRLRRGAG